MGLRSHVCFLRDYWGAKLKSLCLYGRHFVTGAMASLPSTIYLHLEALLLLVTGDMNSLHPTAWALEQQTHELPTKRVILVGLCGLHPMTIIISVGFTPQLMGVP